MTTKAKRQKNPVLITTEHRGVFQGDLISYDKDEKVAVIAQARCCVAWRGVRGFIDLAVNGPSNQCRVTPAAMEMEIEKVTSIVKCSKNAVTAWNMEPWND